MKEGVVKVLKVQRAVACHFGGLQQNLEAMKCNSEVAFTVPLYG